MSSVVQVRLLHLDQPVKPNNENHCLPVKQLDQGEKIQDRMLTRNSASDFFSCSIF